jgi:ABC-type molybdate transport system substrate-binding protein
MALREPDVYASVNLGHLKELKSIELMQSYMIYMHNELQIMVAKGNPKDIRGIEDLGRSDVRTSLPNPINEGIMQFYARKVLERHGLWQALSGGKECASCQRRSATGSRPCTIARRRSGFAMAYRMPASFGRQKGWKRSATGPRSRPWNFLRRTA